MQFSELFVVIKLDCNYDTVKLNITNNTCTGSIVKHEKLICYIWNENVKTFVSHMREFIITTIIIGGTLNFKSSCFTRNLGWKTL